MPEGHEYRPVDQPFKPFILREHLPVLGAAGKGRGLGPQRFQPNTLENGNVVNTENPDQSALHSTAALLIEMVAAAPPGFRQKKTGQRNCPVFQGQNNSTSSFCVRRAFRGRSEFVTVLGYVFGLFFRLADALDGYDLLILGSREDGNALRCAAGDADAADRNADQLAAVRDQHDLVAVVDREGGDKLADLRRSSRCRWRGYPCRHGRRSGSRRTRSACRSPFPKPSARTARVPSVPHSVRRSAVLPR